MTARSGVLVLEDEFRTPSYLPELTQPEHSTSSSAGVMVAPVVSVTIDQSCCNTTCRKVFDILAGRDCPDEISYGRT